METDAGLDLKQTRKASGRKDEGQPAAINLESLTTKVDHLMKLCNDADAAATDFKDAVTAVAESAGLNAAIVSKFIKAKCSDDFEARKGKVVQMALVFEECAD